jgi:glycosyltransferase involved in cell wall biosynthesis
LDPVKRPWVFSELARSFPEVEFVFAGKPHFHGPRTWEPSASPPNVVFAGHVEGEEKRRLIASSWVLVNTSIHEGLPVSVQESLACGVPLLSTLDPEGLASRFGVFVGQFSGDGMDALPPLREGMRRLLGDHAWRRRLGAEGRAWLLDHHTPERFLRRFQEEAAALGRKAPPMA